MSVPSSTRPVLCRRVNGNAYRKPSADDRPKRAKLEQGSCDHPGFYQNMCIGCGKFLDDVESGVTVGFGYIQQGLRLRNDEITRIRDTNMKNLFRKKKLCLVLDLDHTLLNTTHLEHLTPDEEYLNSRIDSFQGNLFRLDSIGIMTKLRPFVHTFLKEASKMFELYIYTMGNRPYALQMAKLLDPRGEYFNGQVISRDDGTQEHQKSLDVVLEGTESRVLILDDTKNVWRKHEDNLILMERYSFFASSCCTRLGENRKSLSQLVCDESELEGALSSVLQVLHKIHTMFFDRDSDNIDVRRLLKEVRRRVLEGVEVVFSHVIPTGTQPESHRLWKMAEELGATCSTEVRTSVTHVVSKHAETKKSRWAVKENKFLVSPRWLDAAYFLWQKQPEKNFSVLCCYC